MAKRKPVTARPSGPPPLVVYHAGCSDGFGAAFAAWRWDPAVELVPRTHGEAPPEVAGRDVYVFDFAFDRPTMEALAASARSVLLADHHASAQRELGDLPYCRFDMNRSGAGLAWDVLHPGKPRPWIVDYVEDRDLWRWALPHSREVSAALASFPMELDTWARLAEEARPEDLVPEGRAILRFEERQVERLLRLATRMEIAGHDVPAVNSPVFVSELGHRLSIGEPFAVVWHETADGQRAFSLRSQPDGLDVSEIAKGLGGGGHPRAAGFRRPPR